MFKKRIFEKNKTKNRFLGVSFNTNNGNYIKDR
jgi:hypothetical protein